MKQLSIFAAALLSMIFNISFGQTTGQIIGNVADNRQNPVIAASISLLKLKDSSLVITAVTDKSGKYTFQNLNYGSYRVTASSAGYSNVYSEPIVISDQQASVTMQLLELKEKSSTLNTVTVTAQKPMIEIKADKTVLNVAGSINAAGSTAMELLQKSPGVRVDKDDNISMNGKKRCSHLY